MQRIAELPTAARRFVPIAAALLLALAAVPAHAAAPSGEDFALTIPVAHAAGPGEMVKAPDLGSDAELVRLNAELLPTLLRLARGQKVRIADWPVAPGIRRDVIVARHEVYAPGARIMEAGAGGGLRELPHSRLAFYWGVLADEAQSGVFASIDPVSGTLESMTESGGVRYQMSSLEPGKPGLHLLAAAQAFIDRAAKGHKLSWKCGAEGPMEAPQGAAGAPRAEAALAPAAAPPVVTEGGSSYNLGTVAIDTDYEFMNLKFAGDTTAATNYIASMFAEVNVMYERDLQTELLQGTTILRTSAASDPYTQTSSTGVASSNQLQEFSDYWAANEGSVTRTVAALLSGKSSSPYEASGIAWVGGLCSASYGYSFQQLFTFAADSSSMPGDTLIFGHEIGHNFGTRHTHCYSPPIDECYNLESGCWSGAESCPAPSTVQGVTNVLGTVMSYCHLLSGCSSTQVFHPRVIAVIEPQLEAALGVCMTAAVTGPSVSAVSPNHGTAAGGTAITITGSNFQSGATVTVGGIAATSVMVVSSTTITAVTGAHATGKVDVVVTSNSTPATLAASYFYTPLPAAVSFYTVPPCRMVDTRAATGPNGGPILAAGASRVFTAAGRCGVPSGAIAISANVTVVSPATSGYFSLFPGNAFALGTSSLNFTAGEILAGSTIVDLATDGTGTFGVLNGSAGTSQFVLDVNGYFQ